MNSTELIQKLNEEGFVPRMFDYSEWPAKWQEECGEKIGKHPGWGDDTTKEARQEWSEKQEEFYENKLKETGIGPFKTVESRGGEGMGEEYWNIIHFKDHDVYLKEEGFYTSFDGTDFVDEFVAVTPQTKTVTVYE